MSTNLSVPLRIFHLALAGEWQDAVEHAGPYRRSTLGRSLHEVGFIHCSFARQVQATADLIYRHQTGVVLLVIDPSRVPAELRIENLDGGDELFPHIYGDLPLTAVVRADPVPLGPDGTLALAPLVPLD